MKQGIASNVSHLIKTLEFLNNTAIIEQIPKKKDPIVHEIVCRIQNLLPDDCAFCKTRFKLGLTEKPILRCAKCGQSSHKPCITELLKNKAPCEIPESDEITDDFIIKLVNPLSFSGMHYLCKSCEVSEKFSNSIYNEEDADEEDPTPTQEEAETVTTIEPSDSPISISQTVPQALQPTNTSEQTENTQPPPAKKSTICKFFKKNSCRHGAKGDGCLYSHPELCKKFIQHGTRQPRGCNMGSRCKYLHPEMCMNSLRKGKCLSNTCRYRHIKGTTRHEAAEKVNVHSSATPSATSNASSNAPQQSSNSNNLSIPSSTNSNSFLEAIRLLKAELLEEMDKRMPQAMPTQVPYYPQQLPQQQQIMPAQIPQQFFQMSQPQRHAFIKQPQILPNPQQNMPLQQTQIQQQPSLTINQAAPIQPIQPLLQAINQQPHQIQQNNQ